MTKLSKVRREDPMRHALRVVQTVCQLAGPASFIEDLRRSLSRKGVIAAVRRHDTAALFDWLMHELSFQGIADRVAHDYLRANGNATWTDIEVAVSSGPSCPKLGGYWLFNDCGFEKTAGTCSEPGHFQRCPLPKHPLRNGRLNQTAYSLFLFIRDVADGDLIQWIDDQLAGCASLSDAERLPAMRQALIEPLRGVYGISDKVISMALSSLLLAAGRRRPCRSEVGASFVVVDTLVHNFLHRTGILGEFQADHAYGPTCYRPGGCADLIESIATQIDARTFNPDFPSVFPRFVQFAIWRYCSENGLDICNGNRINDSHRCDNIYCQLRSSCRRVKLRK